MKTRKAPYGTSLSIALVAILIAAGVFTNPIAAQSGRALFNWIIADKVLVQSGGLTVTGTSDLAGVVTASDDVAVGDDLTVADDAIFGSDISASPQTTLTVTMNGWITPTGTLQLVSAAGAVSLSGGHLAPGTAGDVLVLLNVGAQTITISETTGLISAGNIALGTLDSATLVWRLANWYQVAASNN